MRRRLPEQPQQQQKEEKDASESADFMDEDEQDQLVKTIEDEAAEQFMFFSRIFKGICFLAVAVSWLDVVTASSANTLLSWILAAHSSVLHLAASSIAIPSKNGTDTTKVRLALVFTALEVILLLLKYIFTSNTNSNNDKIIDESVSNVTIHHWGLAISNMITMTGAMLLRWDSSSTIRALSELESSKYHYKSL